MSAGRADATAIRWPLKGSTDVPVPMPAAELETNTFVA